MNSAGVAIMVMDTVLREPRALLVGLRVRHDRHGARTRLSAGRDPPSFMPRPCHPLSWVGPTAVA